MTCTNCGKELEDGVLFCDACGTKILQEAPAAEAPVEETTYVEQTYAPEEAPEMEAPKSKKKLLGILVGAVAVVAIALLVYFLFFGKSKPTLPTLYVADRQIVVAGKGDPWNVTSELDSTDSSYAKLAPNGKTLFYYDDLEDGRNIYFRDITKASGEATKLASDTTLGNIRISKNSKTVVYLTDDNELFTHNLKDEERIATDVGNIEGISEDCKKVIYTTKPEKADEKPALYFAKGTNTEQLVGEVDRVYFVNEKLTELYYSIDGELFKLKVKSGDKEPIDEDISSVWNIYESGEMYYTKTETDEKKGTSTTTLFYYDGKEAFNLAENDDVSMEDYAVDTPVVIYKVTDVGEKETTYTTYIAVDGEATELKLESKDTSKNKYRISDDGKVVYYLDNYNEKDNTFDLYKLETSDPAAAEVYDNEVAAQASFSLYEDGTIMYGKKYKDGTYDLYVDQELVDYKTSGGDYYEDIKSVIYATDAKSGAATMHIWKKGNSEKIAEKVADYYYANNGKIVYLADVSEKNGKGTVYEYRKGKSEKVADGATALVHISLVSYDD